jgi:hypothetical protein
MRIHATCNTVAAAAVFFVLSGIASLGNADLNETSLASVRHSYALLNARAVDAADALRMRPNGEALKGCDWRSEEPSGRA